MTASDDADGHIVESVLAAIRAGEIDTLVINDLTLQDLDALSWSGNSLHIRSVEAALRRVLAGEVEYLALRAPGGEPVVKGGIDYAVHPDAGTLWALATHPQLQGLGLGTRLIAAAESRIVRRGRRQIILGVEADNLRARTLYERLGYRYWKREQDSWDVQDQHGTVQRHDAEVIVFRKVV